jgi:antitoxin ParD1/3/4/toxin ParE1/3/4
MTPRYYLLDAAARDIEEIAAYWEAFSPAASIRLQREMMAAIEHLAITPGMGQIRQDITNLPVRFWNVRGRYIIVYSEHADGVEIVRVFGASQDIASLMV